MESIDLRIISNESLAIEVNDMLLQEPMECNAGSFTYDISLVNSPFLDVLVITNGNDIVGHMQCFCNGKYMEITKLYVFHNHRGKGYGIKAVNRIIEMAFEGGILNVGAEPLDKDAFEFWKKTKLIYNEKINRFELHII
ncbi:TPA: GNAT family N-acetyltransferase [Serratia fonticola]